MMTIRPAAERGATKMDWLDSRHSFSFNRYDDPAHAGFGELPVINDDRVAPGAGFETHGHRDMEILTYVLDGTVEHRDTLGTRSVIGAGEVQRMTAGTGIQHSEFNPSPDQPLRFLQIWIRPDAAGLAPGYEQHRIDPARLDGRFALIAARTPVNGALSLHQDVNLYAARLAAGGPIEHQVAPARRAWLQVATGRLAANGETLGEGDGLALEPEADGGPARLALEALEPAEVLLFDLAGANAT